jgi:HK97 family phage major capsid protein
VKHDTIKALLGAELAEQAGWTANIPAWHPRALDDDDEGQRGTSAAFKPRTVEEFAARQEEIRGRLDEIHREYAGQRFPDDIRDEWNALNEEHDGNEVTAAEVRSRTERIERLAGKQDSIEGPQFNVGRKPSGEAIYDVVAMRNSARSQDQFVRMLRDNAMRAVEAADYPHPDIDRGAAQGHIERLMQRFGHIDKHAPLGWGGSNVGEFSERILRTGSAIYERAFGKYVMGGALTADEQRALSLTTTAGGFAVPFTLDPTIIPTSNLSVNPYRAIARQETIATTTWQGITSAGVTASYSAEGTEATDGAPSIAQPTATPVRATVTIPYSIEIGQDWGAFQMEMASLIQDAKDDLEAVKFTSGSGTNEPQGILTGATLVVTGAGTGTFALADVFTLEQTLPPRFRPRARVLANRAIYNLVRQFDTGGGGGLWLQVAPLGRGLDNNVPTPGNIGSELLGYPAYEASSMASSVATNALLTTLGDFRYFLIVDRVGMDVEVIPHLFGATNRLPVGQRALYAFWRNTSVVLSTNAFRTLKVR